MSAQIRTAIEPDLWLKTNDLQPTKSASTGPGSDGRRVDLKEAFERLPWSKRVFVDWKLLEGAQDHSAENHVAYRLRQRRLSYDVATTEQELALSAAMLLQRSALDLPLPDDGMPSTCTSVVLANVTQAPRRDCYMCEARGDVDCVMCSASGKRDCADCRTTGTIKCHICDGAGRVAQKPGQPRALLDPIWIDEQGNCKKCKRTGRLTCKKCSGSGEIQCSNCLGRGVNTCTHCEGSGHLVRVPVIGVSQRAEDTEEVRLGNLNATLVPMEWFTTQVLIEKAADEKRFDQTERPRNASGVWGSSTLRVDSADIRRYAFVSAGKPFEVLSSGEKGLAYSGFPLSWAKVGITALAAVLAVGALIVGMM